MELSELIIALFFFIAVTIVSLTFVVDMYSIDGYNIDLNSDNSTVFVGELIKDANAAKNTSHNAAMSIQDKTIGQPNANIQSGSVTEADMIKSSLFSLTNIWSLVDVFTGMTGSFFNALGLGGDGTVFWFITIAIITIVSFIMIGAALKIFF